MPTSQKHKLIEMVTMTDLEKLKATYTDIEIDFVIRVQGDYQYLFIGKPEQAAAIQWLDDNFVTSDLDALIMRNPYFEFEFGKLVSWS